MKKRIVLGIMLLAGNMNVMGAQHDQLDRESTEAFENSYNKTDHKKHGATKHKHKNHRTKNHTSREALHKKPKLPAYEARTSEVLFGGIKKQPKTTANLTPKMRKEQLMMAKLTKALEQTLHKANKILTQIKNLQHMEAPNQHLLEWSHEPIIDPSIEKKNPWINGIYIDKADINETTVPEKGMIDKIPVTIKTYEKPTYRDMKVMKKSY